MVLHKDWMIVPDEKDQGREKGWENGIPEDLAKPCVVPSFAHQAFPNSHGIFWYQKSVTACLQPSKEEVIMLRIGSADFLCEVYVNGEKVGLHRGTENPFAYDITAYWNATGENLLVFRVSKPYSEEVDGYNFWKIPHRHKLPDHLMPGYDYNTVGISGKVELVVLPKLRIADMYLHGNMETAQIDVEYTIHSDYEEERELFLDTRVSDKRTGELCADRRGSYRIGYGDTTFSVSVPIKEVQLWSPEDPFLYSVCAVLSTETEGFLHTLTKRTGFREMKVGEDGYFYLNGKRIFLKGSHTLNYYPYTTSTIPHTTDVARKDLLMAKTAGLNMIRFISGAALPEQLDYADELGIMVYEEPMASWMMQDSPLSRELYEYDLVTMLQRDRSHPSVCIWGMLNETVKGNPFGECCQWGRESLALLRTYDKTRLVLYSSGRFDHDITVGSLANPYSDQWQCLWNHEDERRRFPSRAEKGGNGFSYGINGFDQDVGDMHMYPRCPIGKKERQLLRTVGCDVGRPVFLSEMGTGSLFDTVWLTKYMEGEHGDREMPDARQIFHINDCLMRDLKEYGFETEYGFPQGIMQESFRLHARQRAYNFDMIRSNPYINGYSITGLLDHGIAGEGLFTLMREWKTGVVDVMQSGLAKLKWCMLLEDMHIYAGRPVRFEVVIANEDQLEEKAYPVCFRVLGEEGVVWEKRTEVCPTADQLKTFAVPVLEEMITLDVPTGQYRMYADIEGAAIMDNVLSFYVTNPEDIKGNVETVVVCGINEATYTLLEECGISIISLEEAEQDCPAFILVGCREEKERPDCFAKIHRMLAAGSRVFFADHRMFSREKEPMHYWFEEEKPIIEIDELGDWLYHKEYLAKRKHPYFKGLPQGMMDWEYWMYLINGFHFRGGRKPDDIASISFGTGLCNEDGYLGGFNLAAYCIGEGKATITTYDLSGNIGRNPAADRLLLNILDSL